VNDAPVILGQVPLQTLEEQQIDIRIGDLIIDYPGGDPADLTVIIHGGPFYTVSGTRVIPQTNFSGVLSVPVTVSDGIVESGVFELSITVDPVNDAPSIDGQHPVQTFERTPTEISVGDLILSDPDNAQSELSVRVLDGAGYHRVGNTITPEPGVIGALEVRVVASDGELDSQVFDLLVQVLADSIPPVIVVIGPVTIYVREGTSYIDGGATATDNVDGDISDRIVVVNPVNADRAGTYTVTYRVEDLAGNAAVATRTVIVQATVPVPSSGGGGAVSILFLTILIAGSCYSRMPPSTSILRPLTKSFSIRYWTV
jgi:hypothetical protein